MRVINVYSLLTRYIFGDKHRRFKEQKETHTQHTTYTRAHTHTHY